MIKTRLFVAVTTFAAVLASPAGAFALNVNESYQPQNEFELVPWVNIEIFGIDMSINKAVVYVLVAALLSCVTLIYVGHRMKMKPGRLQAAVEMYYGLIESMTKGNLSGKMVNRWFPFLATIFLFIWYSNMIGYIPLPTNTLEPVTIFGISVPSLALYAATANISVPLVLTLVVVISYHVEGVRAKGPIKYLKGWVPAGVEGPAAAPIFLIEVISQFVRIVSLSVRLFANMLAGHLLILFMGGGLVVLLNLALIGSLILGLVTGTMAVAFFIFEVGLVATLQAFIFTILAAIYLGGAVAEEH
ncbi:MAG: F0F1 ATP synthase subunit A [Actinomycetes bacterium]